MDQVFNLAEEEGEEEESGPTESTDTQNLRVNQTVTAADRAAEESTSESNSEDQDEGEEKGRRRESEHSERENEKGKMKVPKEQREGVSSNKGRDSRCSSSD